MINLFLVCVNIITHFVAKIIREKIGKYRSLIMSSTKHKEKPQKSKESTPDEKVRILCLHGYRQNGNTFKSKIGK